MERFVSAYRHDGGPEVIQGIFQSFDSAHRSAVRKFGALTRQKPRPENISTEARTERFIDGQWREV